MKWFRPKASIKNPLLRLIVSKWGKIKRRHKILILLTLLIGGGILFFQQQGKANQLKRTEVSQVTRRDIDRKILRSGILEHKGISEVFSPSDGQITAIMVRNGDTVKKNQPLFKVTSSASQEEKAQARSVYLSAKNALEKARQGNSQTQSSVESARQTLLKAEQAVKDADDHRGDYTDREYEALKSAERAARLELQLAESDTTTVDDKIAAAQADFQVAWLKYQATQDTTVLATIGGRVENLSAMVGDVVAHTQDIPVLLIVSNPKHVVSISIGEIDAALLKASQSAELSVDAFPDTVFPAVVSRIDAVGTRDADGVTYTAWLELTEVNTRLLSGMAVDAEILIETKRNVLAVPNTALQYRTGKYFLTLGDEKKKPLGEKEVKIGIRDAEYTEITSGIEENEKILVLPHQP